MGFLDGMDISASGLTAQRLRMDVISDNIANIDTTRTESGDPYKRKYVVLQERPNNFSDILGSSLLSKTAGGVVVSEIGEDASQGELVYDPSNPDANQDGYVEMPNVDITQEMVDMISAYRSYEANVTSFNAYKEMAVKTLEIGK
ncbi:Flagellar basal-body rod protein FlgC [bioreactor metagenome]|uniref:Flagellar basal-body rod protein FlgC n=1 Tax=bioreactor metagenome TaxID=1076179 RepID=A0A644YBI3_9ZZZZ